VVSKFIPPNIILFLLLLYNELIMEKVLKESQLSGVDAQVLKIITIGDEEQRGREIHDFVQKRIATLEQYNGQFVPGNSPFVDTFIGSRVIVRPGRWTPVGYYFDDPVGTIELPLQYFAWINEKTSIGEGNYQSQALRLAFESISNYFGGDIPRLDAGSAKYNLLYKHSDLDPINESEMKVASIRLFYEKRLAECTERSIFAHNLLLVLGLRDTLCFGKVSLSASAKKEVAHAFNIFTNKNNGAYITDFTLPILKKGLDEHKYFSVFVKKLSSDQFEQLKKGCPVSLDYPSLAMQEGTQITYQIDQFI